MTNLTNQNGKVNSKTELQEMAEKLNWTAKCILNPREGMKYYKILREMQQWYDYDQNHEKGEMQNIVYFMEELRDFFLQLDQYQQVLDRDSKSNETLVEFKYYER